MSETILLGRRDPVRAGASSGGSHSCRPIIGTPVPWGRYSPARTLLIDDSLPVLRSARQGGIAHLLAVYLPDTRQPEKDVGEFAAMRHFAEIMPK